MKSLLTLLLSLFLTVSLLAQPSKERLSSGLTHQLLDDSGFPIYAKFDHQMQLKKGEFLQWIQKHLNLPNDHHFIPIQTFEDQLGFEHTRYQQMVQDIPVLAGMYVSHNQNGIMTAFNGHCYPVDLTNSSLSPDAAKTFALNYFDAENYRWEESQKIKTGARPPLTAIAYQLIYAPNNLDFERADFKLCYEIELYAIAPLKKEKIYVDAQTGAVVAVENQICQFFGNENHNCTEHSEDENCQLLVEGTAETAYSGTKTIETEAFNGSYRLRDLTRGSGIYTYNAENSLGDIFSDFTDDDNDWTALEWDNPARDQYALDGHFGAESTYDYYFDNHGRNGIDGVDGLIISYVHIDVDYGNAFWDGTAMYYGDGSGIGTGGLELPTTTVEICAHEYSHGVTEFTAGLIYNGESGGLNESFSDIFGAATDFYTRPNLANWIMADESAITSNGIRSFSNPNTFEQPDTYEGTYWTDFAGVHTLSGVQNFWFYLLSVGGSGVNDIGNGFDVQPIGYENAADIAYRNLSVYLTPSSTYEEAAFLALIATEDLFGPCTPELATVAEAWHAVGLSVPGSFSSASFSADKTIGCDLPFVVNFQELSLQVDSLFWDFGDGTTSQESNPTHIYTSEGNYTVSLTAYSCDGQVDSLILENFIIIDTTSNYCDTTIMLNGEVLTITDCEGIILDPGGIENYPNLSNSTVIIAPSQGGQVTIAFSEFSLESGFDYLRVYDGNSTSGALLGTFSGGTLPPTITSTQSALTLLFNSDGSVTFPGFICTFSTDGGQFPVADFSVDAPIIVGEPFSPLSTNTANTAGQYIWDFGDGTILSSAQPSHTYEMSGEYEINLEVSNCQGIDTFSLSVEVLNNRNILSYMPDSLCFLLNQNETDTGDIVLITEGGAADFLVYNLPFNNLDSLSFFEEQFYNESGAVSMFGFELPQDIIPSFLRVTLTQNGDFNNTTEFASININNGAFEEVIEDGNVLNGTDIITVFEFDESEVSNLLNGQLLPINIINSGEVDFGFGESRHTLSIEVFYNNNWIEITNLSGTTNQDTTLINVAVSSEGLISGTYYYYANIEHNDLDFDPIQIPIKLIVTSPPIAQFEISTASCSSTIQFDNQTLGTVTSYLWDFGDENTSSDFSPIHEFEDSGDFEVSLIACNDYGCDTVTQTITIAVELSCDINLPSDGSIIEVSSCEGTLYDAGGPNDNYSNNINGIVVINSPTNELLQLNFSEFNLEFCCDFVRIYDGNSINAPIIGSYNGNDLEGMTILSTGSNITVQMTSDGSGNFSGFAATWQCIDPIPQPVFTYTTCSTFATFEDLTLVNVTSWDWDFGDENGSSEQNPVHEYATGGSYEVSLIACNSFGCDTASQTIIIDPLQACDINLPSNGDIIEITNCEGTFYDAGGPNNDYKNSISGALVIHSGNGELIQITFSEFILEGCCDFVNIYDGVDFNAPLIGAYNGNDLEGVTISSSGASITVQMTSDGSVVRAGFVADWACFTPTAAADFNYINCGGNVQFEDLSTLSINSWEWNFGDENLSTEQNPLYQYDASGTYDVTLIACNNFGCDTLVETIIINITEPCDLNLPSDGSNLNVSSCEGTLYDSGGPMGNYMNSINGTIVISSPTNEQIAITFTEFELEFCCDFVRLYDGADINAPLIGAYNGTSLQGETILSTNSALTIRMTSDGSVTGSGFVAHWECFNGMPIAGFSFQPTNTFCDNTFEFTNQSIAADSIVWTFGDSEPIPNVENITFSFPENGTHTVTLKAFNSLGESEHSEVITIENVDFFAQALVPDTVIINTDVIFEGTATEDANWQWQVDDNTIAFTENALYSFDMVGTYYVQLIATSFTANCPFYNTQMVTVVMDVGIQQLADDEHIQLFPNPVSDQLFMNYSINEPVTVIFSDILGRELYLFPLTQSEEQLSFDLKNLGIETKGVYFIRFLKKGELIFSEKIIVD